MSRLLFAPISIVSGLIAGLLGKKLFEVAWGAFDDEEPPEPEHREISWVRLVLALAIEGAIFAAVRGLVDRGMRVGFERATGEWPGEEEPDQT